MKEEGRDIRRVKDREEIERIISIKETEAHLMISIGINIGIKIGIMIGINRNLKLI